MFGSVASFRGRSGWAEEMEFIASEHLPLHLLAPFDANGSGNGQRQRDIITDRLAFGADDLDFDRVFGLHVCSYFRH